MNTASHKTAVGEAHSKLILVGEHAVVYGKPAIAVPFPLKARSFVQQAEGPVIIQSEIYCGSTLSLPANREGIAACIEETLLYLNKPFHGLTIKVSSEIPMGRGLGSSAAVAAAIVRSLFNFFGQELSQKVLFSLVHIAETKAHGKASGIDMSAVTSDVPIWFQKEKDTTPLSAKGDFYIVAADTGRIGDTRKAVENVREIYNLNKMKVQQTLDEIEKIAEAAREALMSGDKHLIGELLTRNHEQLIKLGVSDEGLDHLVKTATNAGAFGAKLTGGGLGGCIIALADSMEKASFLAKELSYAGACKSWYFRVEEDTLYTFDSEGRVSE